MWKTAFKIFWSDMVWWSRPYNFKCFKGCLPQILLGTFLNTLSHLLLLYFQIHNNPDNEICAKLWIRIIKIICENSFIILIMKYLLLERYPWNNTCLNIVDVNEELCKPVYYSNKNITFEILKVWFQTYKMVYQGTSFLFVSLSIYLPVFMSVCLTI